ncbi:polysaccharide biosynthesis/export family protein [Paracraurococcus lichenis]|uniref:Polysaccharide biosynthesis/export family protein n=1 Tax=Paracraurococcus lichenis TaxID=3064888 RepID=A0ABT9E917_9PROT|nr:polysaccharide biosynthesis/export family protein [Paracraurococcus sp. LOR1-02]MDO9712565.1 polysaccharide biosynthesis/export family protein [Paracraurococcus sp. LOR1-02]
MLEQSSESAGAPYGLVEIDGRVLAARDLAGGRGFRAAFGDRGRPPAPTVGVGDAVSVIIWQSSTTGLLSAAPGPSSTGQSQGQGFPAQISLPEQVVAADGGITVPFAGRVRAAGRTTLQIQQSIERALANRLVEPQVLVTVPRILSATASVTGDGIAGSRVPLSARGERLLNVIAAAGGAKTPAYETLILVTRDGVTASMTIDSILAEPDENIHVWPDDVITVMRSPKTFSAFGATTNNNQLPFNASNLNLAEAIARAGGLLDARADPKGVFLFRFEDPQVAAAVDAPVKVKDPKAPVPVLYHLDLQQAGGYFLAQKFPMRDGDMIYVAGAAANSLQKFFTVVSLISSPVLSGAILAR